MLKQKKSKQAVIADFFSFFGTLKGGLGFRLS